MVHGLHNIKGDPAQDTRETAASGEYLHEQNAVSWRGSMRKTLVFLVVVGLVGAMFAGAADAGKKKKKKKRVERTVEVTYEGLAIGVGGVTGVCGTCTSVGTGPKDLFMSVKVEDDLNPGAGVRFSYDSDGDGTNDTGFNICGETSEPISLPGSVELTLFNYATYVDCPAGAAISGTAIVTFSNLP